MGYGDWGRVEQQCWLIRFLRIESIYVIPINITFSHVLRKFAGTLAEIFGIALSLLGKRWLTYFYRAHVRYL